MDQKGTGARVGRQDDTTTRNQLWNTNVRERIRYDGTATTNKDKACERKRKQRHDIQRRADHDETTYDHDFGKRPEEQGESQEEPPNYTNTDYTDLWKKRNDRNYGTGRNKHKTPRTEDGNPPDTGGAASSSDTTIPREINTNETTIQRVEHVLTKRGKAIEVSVNEETTLLDTADLTTMPEEHNYDEKKLRDGLDD